jgi:hypothetical protein
MSEFLFERTVSFQFGVAGQYGKRFTDLRVVFDIERTSTSEPNKCKMAIYNLTKDSRALAEKEKMQVILQAGYGGRNETIFQGDVGRAMSRREGADIITEFEAGDGEAAYNDSTVNKSFAPGVNFQTALNFVSQSFGLPVKVQQGVQNETFANGLTLSGSSKDKLDELTSKQGLIWSIQDGAIQILKPGEGTGEEAVLLSSSTGLIGSPKKKDNGIEVTSLLNPKIKPDRPVLLQSNFVRGVLVPQRVKHRGDSFTGDWFTIIEAEIK